VSPHFYGALFALGVIGIMASNLINARLVMRLGSAALLRFGASGSALAGLVLAVNAYTGWGGLPGLVVPLFGLTSCTGFIVANSVAGALAAYPERAGAVSALTGAVQYGGGIGGSALVGAFADGTPWPLGWVIALSCIGSALFAWLVVPTPARTTVSVLR